MPASKRGTEEALDPQAKLRRLDDDGEALHSETAPAINNRSLKEIHMHEMTDALTTRTKRKLSEEAAATEGNLAKSSRQSSPLTSTLSPPVAKHTSASCREAPSDDVNAEFNVDNTPGNRSKDGLLAESDEPSGIKEYSRQVQTKTGCDPQQVSEALASSPTEFVQNEHSYGRASDSSLDSILDTTENTTKEILSFEGTSPDIKFTAEEKDRREAESQRRTALHPPALSLMDSDSNATIRIQSMGTFCSSNGDVHLENLAHGPNCQLDSSSECRDTISSVIKHDLTQNKDQEKHEMKASDALMRLNDIYGEDHTPPNASAEEIVESCNPETSCEESCTPKSNRNPDTQISEIEPDRNLQSHFKEPLTSASESQMKENPAVTVTDSNSDTQIEKVTQSDRNPSSKLEDDLTTALERNSESYILENQGSHTEENVASAETDRKLVCQIEFQCRRTPESLSESLSKEAEDVPQEVVEGNYYPECSIQEIQMVSTEETIEVMQSGINPASHNKANLSVTESDRNPDSSTEDFSISKEVVCTSQEVLIESHNAKDRIKSSNSPENTADGKPTERGQAEVIMEDLTILKRNIPASQEVLLGSLHAQIDETQAESPVQENLTVDCYSQLQTDAYLSQNQSFSTEPTPQEVLVNQFTAQSEVDELGETLQSQIEETNPKKIESGKNPECPAEDNALACPSSSQEMENTPKEILGNCINTESHVEEHQMVSNEKNQSQVEASKNFESHIDDLSLSQEIEPMTQEVLVDSFNAEEHQMESENRAENGTAMESVKNIHSHIDVPLSQETKPTTQEILLGSQISEGGMESDKPTERQLEQNLESTESGNPLLSKITEPTSPEVLIVHLNAGSQVEDNPLLLNQNLPVIESNRNMDENVTKQREATLQKVLRDSFNDEHWVEEKRMVSESQIHANSSEQKQERLPSLHDGVNKTAEVLTPHCEVARNQNRTMEMPRECVIVSQQQTDVEMPPKGRLTTASPQEEINNHSSQNVNDAMMSGNSSSLEKENMCFEYTTAAMNEMNNTASAASENMEHPGYSLEIDAQNNNEPNNHSEMNLGINQSTQDENKMTLECITEDSKMSNEEMMQDVNVQESPEVSNHTTDVTQKGFTSANFKSSGTEEPVTLIEKTKTHEVAEMDVSPKCHIYDDENEVHFYPVATPVSSADLQIQSTEDLVNPVLESENQIIQSQLDIFPTTDASSSEALVEENQEEAQLLDAHENQAELSEDMEHVDSLGQENQTTLPSETSYETHNLQGQMVETSYLEIQHETELPHEVCQEPTTNHSNKEDTKTLQRASLQDNPQTSAPVDSDPAESDEKQEATELEELEVCEVQTDPDFTEISYFDNKGTTQCATDVEMAVQEEDVHMKDNESTAIVSVLENNDVSKFIIRTAINQAEMDIPAAPESVSIPASTEEIQVQNKDNLCVISEVQLKHGTAEMGDSSNAVTSTVQGDEVGKITLACGDSRNSVPDHFVLSESVHSPLEEETGWQGEDTSAKMFCRHNTVGETSESHEVQVLVFARSAESATVTKTEEQTVAVSQSQVENQIVYEPISSPESNGDADVAMVLEKQGLESLEVISSFQDTKDALSTNECMEVRHVQLDNEDMSKEKWADGQTAVEIVTLPLTIFTVTDADREVAIPLERQDLVSSENQTLMEDLSTNESMKASPLQMENNEIAQEEPTDDHAAVEMEALQQTTIVSVSDRDAATALEKEALTSLEESPSTSQHTNEDLNVNENVNDSHLQLENDGSAKEEQTDGKTAVEMEVQQTTIILESSPDINKGGNAPSHLHLDNTRTTVEELTDNHTAVEMDEVQLTIPVPEHSGDAVTNLEKQDSVSIKDVPSTQDKKDMLTDENTKASYLRQENDETAKEEQTDGRAAFEMEVQQTTIVLESSPDINKNGNAASHLHLDNNRTTVEELADKQTVVVMDEGDTATDLEKQYSVSLEDVPSTQDKKDMLTYESTQASYLRLENGERVEEEQTNVIAAVEIEVQQTTIVQDSSPDTNKGSDASVALEKQYLVSSEDVQSIQAINEDLHLENKNPIKEGTTDDQTAVEMEEVQQTTTGPETNGGDLEKQDLLSLEEVPSGQDKKDDMLTNESVETHHLQLEKDVLAKEQQTDGQAETEMAGQQITTVQEISPDCNKDGNVVVALEKQEFVSSKVVTSNQEMEDLSTNESIETSRLQLENDKTVEEEWTGIQAVVEMEVEQSTTISETSPESNQAGDVAADFEKQDLVTLDMKVDLQLENGEIVEEQTAIELDVVQGTTTIQETNPDCNKDGDDVVALEKQNLASSEALPSNQEMKDGLSMNESIETSRLQLENEKTAKEEWTGVQAVVEMDVEQATTISKTSPESNQVGDVAAGLQMQDLACLESKGDLQLENEEIDEERTDCQAAIEIVVQGIGTVSATGPERNRNGSGAEALDEQDFVSSQDVSTPQDMKNDLQLEKEETPNEEVTDAKATVEIMELEQTTILPVSSTASAAVTNAPENLAREEKDVSIECVVVEEVCEHLQDNLPVSAPSALPAVGMSDDASDEYVILEPVPLPESKSHLDIVSQAAVASGLSDPCLVTQVDPNCTFTATNGPQQTTQEPPPEVKVAAVKPSGEEADDLPAPPPEKPVQLTADNSPQSPSVMVETSNSQQQGRDFIPTEDGGGDVALQELQILEDMEIGHEIIVVEVGNEPESGISMIEKAATQAPSVQKAMEKTDNESVLKTNNSSKPDVNSQILVEKPKKQEMNTQARTKARLAALAEQKAAAMKRTANKQQLNLLALCQEIAEDIATDSMLLKRIEEEKQAEAKGEAAKKENPPVSVQEVAPVDIKPPAEPESASAQVPPAEEPPAVQPTPAESKLAEDPPKRRFFVSQVSVPLKAHEKKKLTRYQRLRQVELQREKMSWARMKKMKSDQANQMFSDMDWQASMFTSAPFSTNAATTDPAPKASSPPIPSPPLSSKSASPKPETPEPLKSEAAKTEAPKADASKTEPEVKTEPPKPQTPPTEPVKAQVTRITRQRSKAQTSKATPPPNPTPKVTRSSTRRSLPAVPPPMPNGLKATKPQPVEYKPYKPRPRYSPDDFELDDDPLPAPPKKSGPPPRPNQPHNKSNPPAQSKATLQLKPSTTLAGQIPCQSKPTISTSAQSKPAGSPSAQRPIAPTVQSKPSVTSAPTKPSPSDAIVQSKPASAETQSHQVVSISPQVKTAAASPVQIDQPVASNTPQVKPDGPPADEVLVPERTLQVHATTDKESKDTAASSSSSPPKSPLPSKESSDPSDTQQCEGKPAVSEQCEKMDTSKTTQDECPSETSCQDDAEKQQDVATVQKEVKKLNEGDKDDSQTVIDAGQKQFGAVACSVCGMLYSAASPEDESQHLLFHNQFISAVKYVGWKKERILGEFPDGKIILVLPDDPKYALKKVEEIREMVDNDLGFQQVGTKCPSLTKTFLFITNDKKVAGCLIAEHINEGYRVIEEPEPEGSEGEKVMFERQRAWCCSTTAEPALCGISRIWVVSMMRRQAIASRLVECLRNNFIYGSYLSKDEIAFSDPTPDGKLFATHYFGTSQFLVYNFVSGTHSRQPKTDSV
ncbi:uncharacterized protein LOC144009285 [Festucalex cinctus]